MFARSVHGRVVGVVIALSWLAVQAGATEIALPGIEARFERGALVRLVDGQGRELV